MPPFPGFFSKDPIIAATLTRGAFGDCLFAVCLAGRVSDRRSTPSASISSSSAASVRHSRASTSTCAGRPRGAAVDDLDGECARRAAPPSAASCSSRTSGIRSRPGSRRSPPARRGRAAARRRSPRSPPCCSDWPASGSPTLLYGASRVPAPKPLALLEHKFYWDELYDGAACTGLPTSSPAALARFVEQPIIGGSITELARGVPARLAGARARAERARPLLRARDRKRSRGARGRLPLDAMTAWLTTILIVLPLARRARRLAGPAAARLRSARSRRSSRCSRSASGSSRLERFRLSARRAASSRSSHRWFRDLGVSYHVGAVRLLALARRPHRRLRHGGERAMPGGWAASGRAPTSGSCCSSRARSSVCSRRRICSCSTRSSRRC